MTPTSRDLRLLSATRIAALIRGGELSSRRAVEAHIAQVEAVNPDLNALVRDRFDLARREADAADKLLAAPGLDELPPLHGVPCTIKECFALEGMPSCAGLVHREQRISSTDATAVQRLRRAGAIPMGVTNTSELCMWMESNNYVYGRTNNPYDPGHTVGGSSGGEGAIIGAGASPFGLGSDIGGSIRMPAFFNGVFGHKPSGGMVPGTGQWPIADPRARRYLCTGPLCRKAEDLMPLLRILAGPDGEDPGCLDFELGDPSTVDLSELHALNIPRLPQIGLSPELQQAQARVVEALERRGVRVVETQLPAMKKAFEIWSAMLAEASDHSFESIMADGRRISLFAELAKWTVGRSEFTAMCTLLGLSEKLTEWFPSYTAKLAALGAELKQELAERLGDRGILLFPSYRTTAPRHNRAFWRQLLLRFDYAYACVLNPMEIPVTQVPLGLSRRGLPLGIQVGAARGNDHLCVATALALEADFGGWVPPPRCGF